jgi:hypothetical protein
MFGKPNGSVPQPPEPPRTPASDIARITGGGLVQLFVTDLEPFTFFLFLNDFPVAQEDVESLLVNVDAPGPDGEGGVARATLGLRVPTVTGQKSLQQRELFPCTLQVVALERRISVTCMKPDVFDGLWIDLGLKPDGTSSQVSGAQSLKILLTDGILDARLTWTDGQTEQLLPQEPPSPPAI